MTAARHRALDTLITLSKADQMVELPELSQRDAADQASALAINIIRSVIGRLATHHVPPAQADAFKAQLASLLGQPVGQLLRGQPQLIVAAALEGHAALMAEAMGATPTVSVRLAEPSAQPH